jgi:hypothetical protein
VGQQVLDAVLAADRIEQHLRWWMVEPAGEHLAVSGQDLFGAPYVVSAARSTPRVRSAAINHTDTHLRE